MTDRTYLIITVPTVLIDARPPLAIFERAFRHGLDIAWLMLNWENVTQHYASGARRSLRLHIAPDIAAEFERIIKDHAVSRRTVATAALHYSLVDSHSLGFNRVFADQHRIPPRRRGPAAAAGAPA